jgi:AhpD family alkylhydroperoxidase
MAAAMRAAGIIGKPLDDTTCDFLYVLPQPLESIMSDVVFPIHTLESAPDGSRARLAEMQASLKRIPNLYAIMAESPTLLDGYLTLMAGFEKAGFSAAERQVIYLTAVVDNDCHYCVAAHSFAARRQLTPEALEDLRAGRPLVDPKLEALRAFTLAVSSKRGFVSEADKQAFVAAGYSVKQMLDVVVGVAMKVMTTYVNHFAETPLDAAVAAYAWDGLPKAAE